GHRCHRRCTALEAFTHGLVGHVDDDHRGWFGEVECHHESGLDEFRADFRIAERGLRDAADVFGHLGRVVETHRSPRSVNLFLIQFWTDTAAVAVPSLPLGMSPVTGRYHKSTYGQRVYWAVRADR